MTRKAEIENEGIPAKRTKFTKETFPSMLIVNKPTTFKPADSSVLARVKEFLPMMKNAQVPQNMEDVSEDSQYIEMDLDCGIFDVAEKSPTIYSDIITDLNRQTTPTSNPSLIEVVSEINDQVEREIEAEMEMDSIASRNCLFAKGRWHE